MKGSKSVSSHRWLRMPAMALGFFFLLIVSAATQRPQAAVGTINASGVQDTATSTPTGTETPTIAVTLTIESTGTPSGTATPPPTPVHCLFPDFAPGVHYPTSGGPWSIAAGDFNRDSHPDLTTANPFSNTVSVLLNNGDGTFRQAVDYVVQGEPYSVAVGDFNGDGFPDLVTANLYGNSVAVLVNNGDGTFGLPVYYPVPNGGHFVAVGDFNEDGKLDVVSHGGGAPNVFVLLGRGDGTFQPAVAYTGAGGISMTMAIADFNVDGHLDILTTGSGDAATIISVLFGNGDGTFRPGTVSHVLGVFQGADSGDLNHDGRPDLVAAAYIGGWGGAIVLLGNGDGTFQSAILSSIASSPYAVAVGDFNGDGRPDLVMASGYFGASILLGNGDGTFGPLSRYPAGDGPLAVAVGDFNGDGREDFAAADVGNYPTYHTGVSVLLNTCATTCPAVFPDVRPIDYFYQAVTYLACHGAVTGYADGTFRPYNDTTRGQLTKIVVLAEGWPIVTPTGTPTFSDVPPNHPFYPYVETAHSHGIISGYSDGTFRPGNDITRAQLCKVVVLAEGWQQVCPPTGHFSDVPPDSPFYCFVETAYSHNIISGYADGTFRPGNSATRGQIAKIVYLAVTGP